MIRLLHLLLLGLHWELKFYENITLLVRYLHLRNLNSIICYMNGVIPYFNFNVYKIALIFSKWNKCNYFITSSHIFLTLLYFMVLVIHVHTYFHLHKCEYRHLHIHILTHTFTKYRKPHQFLSHLWAKWYYFFNFSQLICLRKPVVAN